MVKLLRLPASGQVLPSGTVLMLDPEDTQVKVLQAVPPHRGRGPSERTGRVWESLRHGQAAAPHRAGSPQGPGAGRCLKLRHRPDIQHECQLLLDSAKALTSGCLAVLGLDVAPSILSSHDLVLLTDQGDTCVFLYKLLPESSLFLECHSF
ncbi:hypothetical protein mRhiFer1_008501 [Rhinolophus ferrumequinum]|uniref:Uncharacterized protein n=1 Tax=Rhinolophus ferrumequinum TaxID=59479 RepID=A0A7J7UXD9_RHIFE|nr:hypothetical protein mRhiFer1_008501 [Rhinolophus ferrumequinum]